MREKRMGEDISKTIAIVTGATGGIGNEFVRELMKEAVDEIWIIGRTEEKLAAMKAQYGNKIVSLCADLTKRQDLEAIRTRLEKQKVCVLYLINNAGIAQMAPSKDMEAETIEQTIKLNCSAPVILTNFCIPFMRKGSRIINMSSASAFQPVPYINLYASTKAFERSYSRALHMELEPIGITVTAVCPSWVDTKMLEKERNGKKIKFPGIVSPERVAKKAIKDAKRGKDMSICSLYVKCQHINVKFMPQRWAMRLWMKGIRDYL